MKFKTVKCRRCGIEFRIPQEYAPVLYCSAMCRIQSTECSAEQYKGVIRPGYYSKNRRRIMAKGDKIDPYVVYIAKDWKCCLCDEDVDPALRLPDPMAATLEHKVSLALGGLHVWDNVDCAHAQCNFLKAAG